MLNEQISPLNPEEVVLTKSQKRRKRQKKLNSILKNTSDCQIIDTEQSKQSDLNVLGTTDSHSNLQENKSDIMSTKDSSKSREEILKAREAKKLAKQNVKTKIDAPKDSTITEAEKLKKPAETSTQSMPPKTEYPKGKDEVDRAAVQLEQVKLDIDKEQIKLERAAKKQAKQAKKKGCDPGGDSKQTEDATIKETVSETLQNIVKVAKEVEDITAKVNKLIMRLKTDKPEAQTKSKAELRAERRAKQEAQRTAKEAAKAVVPKKEKDTTVAKPEGVVKEKQEDKTKLKTMEKVKSKSQLVSSKLNWFQHLHMECHEDIIKSAINSSLHPAIIKLGVQLATRVVTGANARCIALLDALKKMISDYSLPAKTEFSRGLESQLAASLKYLYSLRQPAASQINAVKFLRHHLTQLPHNVSEFDAKKILHEEIDRYVREQIDMAGEAISIAVRNKISDGDTILTYGCSSLIERILVEAHRAGVKFRVAAVDRRGGRGAARLQAAGLDVFYADLTALAYVMPHVSKVIVGAAALLANGAVVGAAGTALVCAAARDRTLPVLVACETHKVSERVHADALVYNELGNPDDLIDDLDNSPIKDWRSNKNLTLLNLSYDVTPASLVTAVVTELAILPCTSAPVVLRFKLSDYGI